MAKDNLFELIQSLSRSEKRYFTVNGGREDSNHMRLFQLMNGLKKFDDKKLKKVFPKNLSWEKGNLYKLILQSMRNYRSDKSTYAEIKEHILDVYFLREKGLYEQSYKWLQKVKELAIKYNRSADALEISQLEGKLLLNIKPVDLKEQINLLGKEQQSILESIEEEVQYTNAYRLILTKFFERINLFSEEQKSEFNRDFSLEEKDINSFLSPRASYHFLLYQKFYSQFLGQPQAVFDYSHKILKWWKANQDIKKEERHSYLIDRFNYLAACFLINDYDEALVTLNEMSKEPTNNALEKRVLFQGLVQYRHLYYMNIGDFTTAKNEYLNVEKELKKINLDEKNRTTIIINFAILFFLMEDFADCIQTIDKILKNKNVTKRLGVQRFARVLKCICYLELSDVDGFESSHRSSRRFLAEIKENPESFEYQILALLKKLESAFPEDIQKIYQKIATFLDKRKNNPNQNNPIGLDEYSYWVESKLKKISMTTLLLKTHNK
jgi:hypothetical protein